jgi:hypothetical protein
MDSKTAWLSENGHPPARPRISRSTPQPKRRSVRPTVSFSFMAKTVDRGVRADAPLGTGAAVVHLRPAVGRCASTTLQNTLGVAAVVQTYQTYPQQEVQTSPTGDDSRDQSRLHGSSRPRR